MVIAAGHTWADVEAATNRPADVALVERLFGTMLHNHQVTVTSTSMYAKLGMPAVQAGCYFQINDDGTGIIIIDIDQIGDITMRDIAINLRLVDMVEAGMLLNATTNAFDLGFIYNGEHMVLADMIQQAYTLGVQHPELLNTARQLEVFGKYAMPWYRDAAEFVANVYGLDQEYVAIKSLVA